jgi:hypothetical protein
MTIIWELLSSTPASRTELLTKMSTTWSGKEDSVVQRVVESAGGTQVRAPGVMLEASLRLCASTQQFFSFSTSTFRIMGLAVRMWAGVV